MHVCEQAYLRKVISQQLLNSRCLEDVDAHASNIRHCLSPAVKVRDLCLCKILSLVDKGTWPFTATQLSRESGYSYVTVLKQSESTSLVALR